ncbi:MAG: hypothetical protein ABI867_41460 [Kofleriaceae bacterium]
MQPVVVRDRLDRRDIHDLMPQRIRIASLGQRIAAPPTRRWKAAGRRLNLRDRKERPFVSLVAGLTAASLSTRGVLDPRCAIRRPIARRRLARIRRILAEAATKLGVLRFAHRDPSGLRLDRHLLRLDEALQLGKPIFDAQHPSFRSCRSSGVDPHHAARRSGLHPVNAYLHFTSSTRRATARSV